MMALDSYDRALEELVRSLPETAEVSGPQALDLLGQLVTNGAARRLARLRRKDRLLPLRVFVADEVGRLAQRRAKIEGEYLLVMAQAVQQLRRDWEARREALDPRTDVF